MNLSLQLVFLVLINGSCCQAQSEEENLSFENSRSESDETDQSLERHDHSESESQSLEEIRGKQRNDLTGLSKKTSKFQDINSGIKALQGILEKQNSIKQMKTALTKLTEIQNNQKTLKEKLEDQNNVGNAEIKQLMENQNRQLNNYANGRRNLTVLGKTIEVLMEPNGWIVIQSRFDGSVNFVRNWKDYRNGFGSLDGEFWLGLENIHMLTSSNFYELLIQMEDTYGAMKFARYKKFKVDGEHALYNMSTLESYSGTAGDSLGIQRGMKFSTFDRDNDLHKEKNCADYYKGGWWHKACFYSNLNGLYGLKKGPQYIVWLAFSGDFDGLKASKMMIREV